MSKSLSSKENGPSYQKQFCSVTQSREKFGTKLRNPVKSDKTREV